MLLCMLYDSNAIVHSPTPILVFEAPVLQAFGKASQIDASWNPQASKNQTAYNQGLVSCCHRILNYILNLYNFPCFQKSQSAETTTPGSYGECLKGSWVSKSPSRCVQPSAALKARTPGRPALGVGWRSASC